MKPSLTKKPGETVSRKGSKFLGKGEREDALLDKIYLTYRGAKINPKDESLGGNMYVHEFIVFARSDITDFIDPITGAVNVPIEWVTKNVKGFSEYIERLFQDVQVINIAFGLKADVYQVEWRRKKGSKRNKDDGFKRSPIAKAINPEDK